MKLSHMILIIGGTLIVIVIGIIIVNIQTRNAQQVDPELINSPQPVGSIRQ